MSITAAPKPSAQGLPQVKGDPFQHVDVRNFDAAGGMTRQQLIQMGEIASARKDHQAALYWGAGERGGPSQSSQAVGKMMDAFAGSAEMPTAGPVLEPVDATPWAQDSEYQALVQKVAEAAEVAKSTKDPTARIQANSLLTNAQVMLSEAKDAASVRAAESGQWTAQDELVVAAQQSLAEKAALVEQQFRGKA
jgi:hypothetical protein